MAKKKIQQIACCLAVGVLAMFLGACGTIQKWGDRSGEPSSAESASAIETGVSSGENAESVSAGRTAPVEPEVYHDVWDRVRDGFRFPELDSPHTDFYVRWYSERPEYMERMVNRASRYLYYIVEELERNDFPMEIALLPAIESAYKPHAYSRAHAVGMWQFISATGRRYGMKQNWWYDGRRDIVDATAGAIGYLSFLRDEFNGDWFHALAAYNGGENRVRRAIAGNRSRGKPVDYQHLNLRRETERYVPKLLAVKRIVQNPEKYNISLAPIPNKPYFEIINVGSQIDLSIVADYAGVSPQALEDLNPGFRRWATDPTGPHRVLVPAGTGKQLAAKLESLPSNKRMRWARYDVRQGDTLSEISRRYGVSVNALQTSNRLRGTLIRVGQNLLIPLSSASIASTGAATGGQRSGQAVVHQVERGDTLWGIARRYQVPVRELQRWNEIASRDVLRLGQKITVYLN